VFAVVAPCFGPEPHVIVLMCIPHQMPTYFIGLIQLVFSITLGGFRLRPSTDGTRSSTRSATWIVRHGVSNGVRPRTLIPSLCGASAARRARFSIREPARFIRA
jgi:hypothetical protein